MGGPYPTFRFRQRIPRPAEVRPGPPPSWESLPSDRRRALPLSRLLQAVDALPAADGAGRTSFAVLAPVFALDGESTVLLIRRSRSLRRDAGHIAFPGGRVEPGEQPLDAALREAREETGLDRSAVATVRRLESVARVDGDSVAAFLGVLSGRPELSLNPDEVEATIALPLAALLADGAGWEERWLVGGNERSIHFFADPDLLGDDLIWGLTARILWSLLERVSAGPSQGAGPSPGPTQG